ncbi:toxin-antitoxin system, toxin component, PIN domain protein [Trichinella nativa]|uniref:Toxin-antitoxin system, toxin component, PIN domain protein n=1 Tax=Trichinella nativa TaxID=6335 RepID=A0A1Y3EHK7_9BILA|nr:toxin-antitoxin system, toxin component, PIN domain protein [Trichinella nativa]
MRMRSMPSYNMTTKLQLTRSERMPSIRIVNVQGQQVVDSRDGNLVCSMSRKSNSDPNSPARTRTCSHQQKKRVIV